MVIKVTGKPSYTNVCTCFAYDVWDCICSATGVEDWCGVAFKGRIMDSEGYGEVNIYFGFGSSYDDDRWLAEICDGCFETYFKARMRLESDG